MFYIKNNQLWHFHNASTIFPVNVINSTLSSQMPLQLVVGNKREGVKGGSWRWQGTRLFYEQGSAHNSGVYYSCQDTNGLMGLFLFLRGLVFFVRARHIATHIVRIPGPQPLRVARCLRFIASCGAMNRSETSCQKYRRRCTTRSSILYYISVHIDQFAR